MRSKPGTEMPTPSQKNCALSAADGAIPASIVWFEIPADNTDRARNFYRQMFGWNIERFPGPKEYWHINTGGPDASPDGGLIPRQSARQQWITNYVSVPSVDEAAARVQELGGSICLPKTPVPQMGYFAICQDTEGNTFAVWETSPDAK